MAPGVVGSVFTLLVLTFIIRLAPKDIVLEQHNEYKHQISCGNLIAETKKYVYLNDIAIDSLNPRYDLHNNNGGHVKNVKKCRKKYKDNQDTISIRVSNSVTEWRCVKIAYNCST
jgi:hypothetical protein